MFEKKLSALESRKRLLIAESDLNRVLLTREYHALIGHLWNAFEPIKYFGALASSAATLLAVFKAFRNRKAKAERPQSSWLSMLRMGLGIWLGLRGKKTAEKPYE